MERFEGVNESDRFIADMEFVQALCNVRYLHYLSINKYFADPAFMAYLEYLQYWKRPEYSRLLQFPQCLKFLDVLIESENFRTELGIPSFVDFAHQQQGASWFTGPLEDDADS